jgi:NAD(P)H-flavin reductase
VLSSDDEAHTFHSKPVSPTAAEKLDFSIDIEKAPVSTTSTTLTELAGARTPWDSTATLNTTYGRPDVNSLIKDVVAKAQDGERVVIAACGPPGLMKTVRSTAASAIQLKGPNVELHCEAFGW